MVKSAQAVTVLFTTSNPTTGAAADATGTPTGTLYVNGTANGATVTVTNIATGIYKAALTLPSLSAGDVVSLRIAATVSSVAGEAIIWQDVGDTVRMSDPLTANPGTGGIVAASFGAGAIDAAAIADNAIGALELAAGAASEIATAVRAELATELARVDAAISTRLATAGYTAPPSIAEIVDATFDELLAGHAIPASAGAALSAAGGAADPLLNAVPGAYAAGTAGYILGNLPDRTVNVVAPILTGQDLEFNHGYDYLAADGRSEDVTVSTWPTLTGATVVLKFGGLTWSVVSVTAATTIRIAIPRARWADIPLSEGTIQYSYVIQATLANADIVDLMTGTIRVVKL